MKKSINHSLLSGLSECFRTETGLFASCFKTEDHQEATKAFLEKREHREYERK